MTLAQLAAADPPAAPPAAAPPAPPAALLRVTAHAIPDPDPPYDDEPPAIPPTARPAAAAAGLGEPAAAAAGPDAARAVSGRHGAAGAAVASGAAPAPGAPAVPGGGYGAGRERPLEPFRDAPAPAPAALRLVPSELLVEGEEESFDPVRTPRDELEDPLPRAAMLTRALLEAMAGTRPVSQLAKWVTADVLAVVQAGVVHRGARPSPTALRRVLVSEPVAGVAEVTALVDRGARIEALALRLEGLDGRWLVTALQRA